MQRPLYFIIGGVALGFGVIRWAYVHFALNKAEVINCLGFLLLLASAMLLYYQIKSGLAFERRRATTDFIYGPVIATLLPLEKDLRGLTGQRTMIFEQGTVVGFSEHPDFSRLERVVIDVLNFYERMAISLRSAALDEHMLYDDRGAVLISFHDWAKPLIEDFRKRYGPRFYANVSALVVQWRRRYDKAAGRHKRHEMRSIDSAALPKRDLFS